MPVPATRPCRSLRPTLIGLAGLATAALAFTFPAQAQEPVRVRSKVSVNGAPHHWELGGDQIFLRWRNGDELVGRVSAGPAGRVRFAGGPFTGPFDLDPGPLSGMVFGSATHSEPEPGGPFELVLKNGDRLRGRLVAIDETALSFHCGPLGAPVSIPRSEILRVARVGGDGGGFSGLGDLDDWTSTGRDRKPTDWYTDLGGELATHQWSGNLFREIHLPERVEVRFRARFPGGSPHLEVGLLRDPQQGPMLETWDNYLVLTHRTRFVPIMELTPETRELHLRLFWDQRAGRALLCDPSGKPLASIAGETAPQNPDLNRRASDPLCRGFSILSRNSEMKFVALEVREWDGGPVPLIDLSRPRLHLRDSPVRFETGVSLAPGSDRLRLGGESKPLDTLLEWVLSTEDPSGGGARNEALAAATRLAWLSGTALSGEFVSLEPDRIALRPPWSATPVVAGLAGARELRFPESAGAQPGGSDTLHIDATTTLRGTVRLARTERENGSSLLAWQPPGAAEAVSFTPDASLEIIRSLQPDADAEPPVSLGQARLYLDTDEILTGRLLSLDRERVVFESRVTGRVEVSAGNVRAIDIGTSGRILEGFRDPEWEEAEELPEEVEITPDTATMKNGSFGNPSILLGDRIRFDAEWRDAYGAMTLRLFASGPDLNTPSVDLVLAAQGNRLFIGKMNENGAFSFSGDQIPIVNNRASIDIAARPEEIEVRINGKSALTLEVDPQKASGNGIYFKMGGGWQGWNQADSAIAISRFRIESSPGSVPRRVIDPRAKSQNLAIPRTMRESLPSHLLLAPNGDLLRGVLESVEGDSVRFHANGELLEFPRQRVSGIVRLDPPAPPQSGPRTEGDKPKSASEIAEAARLRRLEAYDFEVTHQIVLRDGSRLRLAGTGVAENRLAGRSPVLGPCRVSLDQLRQAWLLPSVALQDAKPMDLVAFHDWRLEFTPDPVIPEEGGGMDSPLVGKEAPAFELGMLDDSTFRLADHRGRIVVLDFWATWCGPCIKAMPEVMAAVAAFPPEAVVFCAVNQGETPPLVSAFLEARDWQDTPVALDFNLKVGNSYQAEGIPHTVVIDPEGKIAWVHSGFSPDLKQKLFEAIAKVLTRQP